MKPIKAAIVSCQGQSLNEPEKKLFAEMNPVGLSLFGRNIDNPEQIKALVKEIKETIGRADVIIAIDQEGGRVRRLAEPYFRSYAANITLGSLPIDIAMQACKLQAQLISADLHNLGINLNYAPVLDLYYPDTNAALKSRCFSNNAQTTAQLGKVMIDEYLNQGILPCLKHLPGHGRATTDPHLNLPKIDASLEELAKDFYPFQFNANAPVGMTAHIIASAVDNQHPITQSAKSIKTIIRDIIGFEGFLITDAIDMQALSGNVAQKTLTSLKAGCDCICYCFGKPDELQAINEVCPSLTDAGLERFYKACKFLQNPQSKANINHLADEYAQIIGPIPNYKDDYDATEILHKMQKK